MAEPIAAGLLLAAGLAFFVFGYGAILVDRGFLATTQGELPFRLAAIYRYRWLWRFTLAVFGITFATYALGTTIIARHLVLAGHEKYALPAAALVVVGTCFGIASFSVHATGTVSRGEAMIRTRELPIDAERMWLWAEGFVALFMFLNFAGLFLLGLALRGSGVGPPWLAAFTWLFGGFLFFSYPVKLFTDFWIADLPLWIQTWAIVAAVALLTT